MLIAQRELLDQLKITDEMAVYRRAGAIARELVKETDLQNYMHELSGILKRVLHDASFQISNVKAFLNVAKMELPITLAIAAAQPFLMGGGIRNEAIEQSLGAKDIRHITKEDLDLIYESKFAKHGKNQITEGRRVARLDVFTIIAIRAVLEEATSSTPATIPAVIVEEPVAPKGFSREETQAFGRTALILAERPELLSTLDAMAKQFAKLKRLQP